MLSKVENGITSPSLTTLQKLARAFSVPLTSFSRGIEEKSMAIQTKAGESIQMERLRTRAYHQYKLFGYIGSNFSSLIVKPYLITLSDEADVYPTFQHAGIETIYVLES